MVPCCRGLNDLVVIDITITLRFMKCASQEEYDTQAPASGSSSESVVTNSTTRALNLNAQEPLIVNSSQSSASPSS